MFLLPLAGQCWAAEWCFPVLCGAQRSHAETFSANICLRCFPGWRSTDLTHLLKVDHPSSALTLPENSSPSTSQVSFPAGILHVSNEPVCSWGTWEFQMFTFPHNTASALENCPALVLFTTASEATKLYCLLAEINPSYFILEGQSVDNLQRKSVE